jgi:hypothetical protein
MALLTLVLTPSNPPRTLLNDEAAQWRLPIASPARIQPALCHQSRSLPFFRLNHDFEFSLSDPMDLFESIALGNNCKLRELDNAGASAGVRSYAYAWGTNVDVQNC